jgi:transposase
MNKVMWSFSSMEDPFDKYYQRRRADELLNEGLKPKEVAQRLGRSTGFVKYWNRRRKSGLGFFDQKRSGRPRKVPSDLSRAEKRLLKRKKKGSSKSVAAELYTKYGIRISDRTVRRDAHRLGLKYLIRKIKPRLTDLDKELRVQFAKRRREHGFWRKVWWSDEKAFTLHNDPRGQWVEVSDEVEPREKDLVEKTVRVWAAISWDGKTKLYRVKPFWNSEEYKTFLEKKAIPNIIEISGRDFIFEQDGDGAHRGKVVTDYFNSAGIRVLDDFTARSPDIPPIENMWAEEVRRLENRKVKTVEGLWIALKEEWDNISTEKIRTYVDSVPGRLKEIIASGGKITKH